MRWLLAVLLAYFATGVARPGNAAPLQDRAQQDPADNGSMAGVVVRVGTVEPIGGAWVVLFLLNPAPQPTAVGHMRSDDAGRFNFTTVMPGIYSVEAGKDGYFSERVWSGPFAETSGSLNVTLRPKERIEDLAIKMTPGGTISGKLVDENGEPAPGSAVHLFKRGYDDNGAPIREGLDGFGTAHADDRGEYRMFGLPPGEYYVEGRLLEYGWDNDDRTFYPNTRDENQASPITVLPAEEVAGINLTVFLHPPAPGVTLSGRIGGALPKKSGPLQTIILMTRDGAASKSISYDNEAPDKAGGRFEIRPVPPGAYDLFPLATDDQDHLYAGHVSIVVGDRDIPNLVVPVQPGVTVKGRILFNGQPPPPDWVEPREWKGPWQPEAIELASPNVPEGFFNSYFSPRKGVPVVGEFTIENVPAGHYTLRNGYGLPDNSYLEDVFLNGKSILDGFEVGSAPIGPVELMVRLPAATVYGSVQDAAQKPASHKRVALVPVAANRKDISLYYSAETDDNGNFAIEGIRPGSYKVFAWESIPRNAWLNADYMQRFESMGELVLLHEGAEHGVKLRIIPRER